MEITLEQKMDLVKELCLKQESKNPVEIARSIMKEEMINIHGPEHHMIDGSAFLTAMHNAGAEFDLEAALSEQKVRAMKMPGATCGQWGVCGASASVGAALAIMNGTGPLSDTEYYKDNMRLTSGILSRMSEIGGPRCCKRNAFLSLSTAVEFVKERYGIELETEDITCEFYHLNKQCIGTRCPFHPNKKGAN